MAVLSNSAHVQSATTMVDLSENCSLVTSFLVEVLYFSEIIIKITGLFTVYMFFQFYIILILNVSLNAILDDAINTQPPFQRCINDYHRSVSLREFSLSSRR